MPLHRVDSVDDALISSDKYDHVVLAYLPLEVGFLDKFAGIYN
jgi:hypothetical protein